MLLVIERSLIAPRVTGRHAFQMIVAGRAVGWSAELVDDLGEATDHAKRVMTGHPMIR